MTEFRNERKLNELRQSRSLQQMIAMTAEQMFTSTTQDSKP